MGNFTSRRPGVNLNQQAPTQNLISPNQRPIVQNNPQSLSRLYEFNIDDNLNFRFIANNPPKPIIFQQQFQQNLNNNNKRKILEIAKLIIEYNSTTWKFGNNVTGNPHPLLTEDTYLIFLEFIRNLINRTNQSQQIQKESQMKDEYKASYNEKKSIIQQINQQLMSGSNPIEKIVNTFFTVKLKELFPNISGLNDDNVINITLLGLCAIIGAEHLVIFFLSCGASPSITYSSNKFNENEDTATLMLSYQIAFTNLDVNISNYFIILPRISYILFLLGSIGEGVNLSQIYKTGKKIQKYGQGEVALEESILHQLVRMPYINNSVNSAKLTLKNGGSITLLFIILNNNKRVKAPPKFFSNINSQGIPLGYTILYSLLMNNTIEGNIKLALVEKLMNLGADPLITPNLSQNSQIKNNQNRTEIEMLFVLFQKSNFQILDQIVQLLSINSAFKDIYNNYIKNFNLGQQQVRNTANIQKLIANNEYFRKIYQQLINVQKKALVADLLKSELVINSSSQPIGSQPIGSQQSILVQAGGKEIEMRTFHFLKNKKYSERAFIAERPIIAADNAYDFMKLHYDIGSKKVTFTIHDRVNNKKYKYTARTLKDGTNVIKSAK